MKRLWKEIGNLLIRGLDTMDVRLTDSRRKARTKALLQSVIVVPFVLASTLVYTIEALIEETRDYFTTGEFHDAWNHDPKQYDAEGRYIG